MKKFLSIPLFLFLIIPSLAHSQYSEFFKYQKPLMQIITNIAMDSVVKVDMRKVRMNKIAGVTVTDQNGNKVEYYIYDPKGNIAQYYQFEDTAKFTRDKLGKIIYTVLDSFPKNKYESILFNYSSEGTLEKMEKTYNDVQADAEIDFVYENKILKTIIAKKDDSDFRKQYNFLYEAINNQVKKFSVANLGVDEIGDTQFRLDYTPAGKLTSINFADKELSFVKVLYNGDTTSLKPNENIFDPVNGVSPLDQVFYVLKNQRITSRISLLKFSTYNVMRIADYVYTADGAVDYINVNYVSYRGVIKTEKLNYTYELYGNE